MAIKATTTSHIEVIKAITTIAGLLGGTTYGIELKLAPGLTFSLALAVGLTALRQRFARYTGNPTTKNGFQR